MHSRLVSATVSQLAFPGAGNPNFQWEKSPVTKVSVPMAVSLITNVSLVATVSLVTAISHVAAVAVVTNISLVLPWCQW